jgi:hypothetical protein
MQSKVVSTIFGVVLLQTVLAVATGESISCYTCNSKTDGWCADPFVPGSQLPTDCSRADNYSLTYTRCLKMNQNVNGDSRVIRGCGTAASSQASSSGCLSRTGTASVRVAYCYCTSSNCNVAGNLRPSSTVAAAASIGAVVILSLLLKLQAPTAAID